MIEGNQGTTLLDAIRVWPTPDAGLFGGQSNANTKRWGGHNTLVSFAEKGDHAARTWSTPVASENANRTAKEPPSAVTRGHGVHLSVQALGGDFPTPAATAYGTSQNGINGKGGEFERPSAGTPGLEHAARHGLLPGAEPGERRVLNPVFVEALMGWELDWTLPCARADRDYAPFPPTPNNADGWARYLELWPATRPAVAPDAVPCRVDRLRACGNGVVPLQAEAAFTELFGALGVQHVGDEDVGSARGDVRSTVLGRRPASSGVGPPHGEGGAAGQEARGDTHRAGAEQPGDVARSVADAERGDVRGWGDGVDDRTELVMGRGETHGGGGPSDRGDKDETRTPLSILDPVEAALGPIEFDPCGHPHAKIMDATVVLLPKYRGLEGGLTRTGSVIYGDGLALDWSGRGLMFCNPPYSDVEPWAEKRHEADEVVYFVPVRTANKWWARTFDDADAICFLYDRVKHVDMKAHADFHQCLVYYGPRTRVFFEGLHNKLGRVYVHERHWTTAWTLAAGEAAQLQECDD